MNKIKSFKNKETETVYKEQFVKTLPDSIQRTALRKLILIDNAESVQDLRVPPGNHLEILKGDRAGQYSIRINDTYRICFSVSDDKFVDVEIVDYH